MSLAANVFKNPSWQMSYSNSVTLARLFLGAPTCILVVELGYLAAGFWLYIAWALTDIVDGSLARYEGRPTVWGAHYDPMADKSLCDGMLLYLCVCDITPRLWLPTIIVIGYDAVMLGIRSSRPGMSASWIAKLKSFTLFFAIGSILGVNAGLAAPHLWPYLILSVASLLCLISMVKYLRD